ncbi:hypothetical protein PVAP13_2NG134403, partial [Panicum virgatum]
MAAESVQPPPAAIGASASFTPNTDEHLRPTLIAFRPPKRIPMSFSTRPALLPTLLLTTPPGMRRRPAGRAAVEAHSSRAAPVWPCAAPSRAAVSTWSVGRGSGRPCAGRGALRRCQCCGGSRPLA